MKIAMNSRFTLSLSYVLMVFIVFDSDMNGNSLLQKMDKKL